MRAAIYESDITPPNAYGGYIAPPSVYASNSLLYEVSPAYDSFVSENGGEMLFNKILELAKTM